MSLVNWWPLRSGQWPENGQNTSSPITSYLIKLEPPFKDQNVPCGLKNKMRWLSALWTILGVKLKKMMKVVTFNLGTLWPQWSYFDKYAWLKDANPKLAQKITPCGTETWKWHLTSSKVIDFEWPRLASERWQYQCKPLLFPRNTYPCPYVHIISKNTEVRKFQALKRYGTQISLDMTLEISSQVKGHSRYDLKVFMEDSTFPSRLSLSPARQRQPLCPLTAIFWRQCRPASLLMTPWTEHRHTHPHTPLSALPAPRRLHRALTVYLRSSHTPAPCTADRPTADTARLPASLSSPRTSEKASIGASPALRHSATQPPGSPSGAPDPQGLRADSGAVCHCI